jgi:hypothetical protein
MTPQERELVTELFDRLATLESAPRDADAERTVAEGLTRAPHAVYALVQTALVQDEALKRANARIQELEGGPPPEEHPRGFLDNVREALLGRDEPRGSVPRSGGLGSSGAWGQSGDAGGAPGGGPPPMQGQSYGQQYGQPYGQPYPSSPFGGGGGGGGGSFLGTAAASAAGVIGGAMLLNGIRSMFGHSGSSASAFGSSGGAPWGGGAGSAANSDLARQAGIDDIGSERTASRDRDDNRSSLLGGNDQDDDNDRFGDDDDTDLAGDFDGGDSDTA